MAITVPILPCRNVNEIVSFYESLGFAKIYFQVRPNPYVIVRLGDIELHFFGLDDFEPEKSLGSCIVQVDDVDALYQSFVNGLRAVRGKVPSAGIPRLTRPRKKQNAVYGFSVIDPGGNWIRIASAPSKKTGKTKETSAASSKLARALDAAAALGDSKGDQASAANLLDDVLARNESAPVCERIPALVYRAELALAMNDAATATRKLVELRSLPLSAADRTALAAELERVSALEEDVRQ